MTKLILDSLQTKCLKMEVIPIIGEKSIPNYWNSLYRKNGPNLTLFLLTQIVVIRNILLRVYVNFWLPPLDFKEFRDSEVGQTVLFRGYL